MAIHAFRYINGKRQYLIHKRLKEPFYGWHGPQTGKIRWGETPLDCAKREFLEETGLTGRFTLKGIVHYHHLSKDLSLLEDKYFWVFAVTNTSGVLREKIEEGENVWLTANEYKKLKDVFATFEEITEVIKGKRLVYIDRVKIVENY